MNTTKYIISSIIILGLLATTSLFGCSQGVSLTDFESLQADYDDACANLVTVQATLTSTQAELDAMEDDLADAESTLGTTQATLATTQSTLADTQATLATTQTSLAEAVSDADSWEALYASKSDDYTDLVDWYEDIRQTINAYQGL